MLRLFLVGLLGCAACGDNTPDDPQGTYHLAVALRSVDRDLLPPSVDFPSSLTWPRSTDLTVQIEAGKASVHILGEQARIVRQTTVDSPQGWGSPLPAPIGAFYFDVVTMTPLVRIDDLAACPQTSGSHDFGNEFELFVFDGQVRGSTVNVVSCFWPDGHPPYDHDAFEGLIFDVTGERIVQ